MSASIYLKRSTAFVVWCFFCDELRGACDLKDIKSYRWLARQMSASIYLKRSTAFVVWRFFCDELRGATNCICGVFGRAATAR